MNAEMQRRVSGIVNKAGMPLRGSPYFGLADRTCGSTYLPENLGTASERHPYLS